MSHLGSLLSGAAKASSRYHGLAKQCENLRQQAREIVFGFEEEIKTKLKEWLEQQFPIFKKITFLRAEVKTLQTGVVFCQLSYYGWLLQEEKTVWEKGEAKFIGNSKREIAKMLDVRSNRISVHVGILRKHPDD